MKTFIQTVSWTALAVAGGFAAPVYAEDATRAAGAHAVQIEEIVVTARRRDESLQSVPISVSVLGGEALANRRITQPDQLVSQLPSIQARPNSNRRSVVLWEMRGITTSDSLLPQDPSIGYYVDEVIINRTHGSNSALFDIENVQALYGPQGTLFGRNTTGGAILITTRKPSDVFEGEVTGAVGNYDQRNLTAVLNVPVGEGFALRGGLRIDRRDGFSKALPSGRELDNARSEAWRLTARWDVDEQLSTTLTYSGTHTDDNGTSSVLQAGPLCGFSYPLQSTTGPVTYNITAPLCGLAAVVNANLAAQRAVGVRKVFAQIPALSREYTYMVNNTTSYEVEPGLKLKNIVAYRNLHVRYRSDLDAQGPIGPGGGNLLDVATGIYADQFSEELQLQGDTERFDWVLGGYYFREKGLDFADATQFQFGPPPWPSSTTDSTAVNTSKSLFAQATYQVPFLEGLTLTAGGRYTWDKREINWHHAARITGTGLFVCRLDRDGVGGVDSDPFGPEPIDKKRKDCNASRQVKFSEPTWTLSADYRWSENLLTYVAHRHGYHAGGFNGRGANSTSFAAFAPEKINDVELGFKANGSVGEMPFRANLAAYRSWYDDLQLTVADLGPPVATVIKNAAKAKIQGFEFDWSLRPFEGLQLSGFIGYVDGEYKEFNTVCPAGAVGCVAGRPITLINIPFAASKRTAGVTVDYRHALTGDLGEVGLVVNYGWRSSYRGGATNFPIYEPAARIPAYGLVNASASWRDIAGSKVSVTVFGRNLTDKTYATGGIPLSGQFGFTPATYGEPRTYGVELNYKFGG